MDSITISESIIQAFSEDASEAARLVTKHFGEDGFFHVVSHLDADGIAAGGIIGKALWRLGARFRVRVQQWMDKNIINDIKSDKSSMTILADLGSGYLNILSEHIDKHQIVILDHHQPVGQSSPNILQVNPHSHGIDGSKDISGAGVAYFFAKALNKKNIDLAQIAAVGALGDLQDKFEQKTLGGLNSIIVNDAIAAGNLKVEKDLTFFGRETRPIQKALSYMMNPFIPRISGEEDKALAFLFNLGIPTKSGDKWRALRDLSREEKQKLCSALSDHLISEGFAGEVLNLIGSVYILNNEEPWTPLRDAREFSVLLNSTGRMDKPGLGIALCMGDRDSALEQAGAVVQEYRSTITGYLRWLTEEPDRISELESIYVIHGGDSINEKMIGTLSSILSQTLPKSKPIIAYAVAQDEQVKISARTIDTLTAKGLNLGEILRETAEKSDGSGGGHDIAAGAQIPKEKVDSFLELANEMVKKKLTEIEVAS